MVEDDRLPKMITYPLNEVLFFTFVGVLCGAMDWEEIHLFASEHLGWFKKFLPYTNGIPCVMTVQRIFQRLKPNALQQCFRELAKEIAPTIKGVIAIDGKTVRRSKKTASGAGAVHILSAFSSELCLVLGQLAVDQKSNEITTIPELLQLLEIEGAIITLDAMGTQKEIAATIIQQNADYIFALKGNQSTLHEDVKIVLYSP